MSTQTRTDYTPIFYPESRFGGFTDADGTIAFYVRVNALVHPSSVVLDLGCGRGVGQKDAIGIRRDLRNFKGHCAKAIGLDVDPAAAANPWIDEFRLIEDKRWPVEDESIDVSVIDSVVEHVTEPETFFAELERITRPGGFVCIRTANVMSYFGLMASLIPNRLHARVLDKVQGTREEHDIFPTVNRCNTRRRLSKMLARHGFDNYVYGHDSEPRYLSFSRLAYVMGTLHQKFAPNWIKVCLFAFGQKHCAGMPGAGNESNGA